MCWNFDDEKDLTWAEVFEGFGYAALSIVLAGVLVVVARLYGG